MKKFFKDSFDILLGTVKGFMRDGIPKMSAALAYYTIFSIPPLITVIIAIGTFAFQQEAVEGKLFYELTRIVGPKLAADIQSFVNNVNLSGKNSLALIGGAISLIIGATAVFGQIQESLNAIWQVKAVPKKGWLRLIIKRLISLSMVITLGFLLLVSLVVSSGLQFLNSQMIIYMPTLSEYILGFLSNFITFAVITFLFAIVFKVLPDVKLKWKPALVGATFTMFLFSIGKFGIDFYIQQSNPDKLFGAAGSIILILVWVYYTSLILYIGAEFTQVYAEKYSTGIEPSDNAVHVKQVEVKKDVAVLPAQNPEQTQN